MRIHNDAYLTKVGKRLAAFWGATFKSVSLKDDVTYTFKCMKYGHTLIIHLHEDELENYIA